MVNLVLIGMPGSGKSTVAKRLATEFQLELIDTDKVIERQYQTSLQQLVDSEGVDQVREIEEKTLLALELNNCIVSTGGSAVYSEQAMDYLSKHALVVYLQISQQTLEQRVTNLNGRGILMQAGATLKSLAQERTPLYQRWADVVIDNDKVLDKQQFQKIVSAVNAGIKETNADG